MLQESKKPQGVKDDINNLFKHDTVKFVEEEGRIMSAKIHAKRLDHCKIKGLNHVLTKYNAILDMYRSADRIAITIN